MSDDFFTRKTYRHRIEVDGTKFIVETWIKGDLRIIQNVWHCRRHRRGGTSEVSIHPNGRRPPSATLAKLWDHLGVSHDALWKECPANHPSFSKQRAIQTAFDVAEESTMHKAAAVALVAQGWSWNAGTFRWDAPPAQAVDLGAMPDGWRLSKKTTCYQLSHGNEIIGNLVGPDAEENAAIIARVLDSQAVGK